ncbi:ABC transporter substrate-binding protein [Longirhabdus pacifica]|uniref:ABC transporter substrate-binding protein n=1 Tax=Longirhabdus pacifica TaxID=2305227 RepID=UPI001008B764|nr:ABC transporter substrate-binding protein [Longirhabdus pacifica]
MKKWKLAMMMLLIFTLSFALIGCGGDDDESGNGSDEEKILIFGRGGDSVTLDPAKATDGESLKVTANLYENLVTYGEEDTSINPQLATEWEVSEDGLLFTFKLREGVKFHDGTDFNAEAVVTNFNLWASDLESYYYYNSQYGDGNNGTIIEEVKAIDDYTVEFKLTRSQATFLQNMAMDSFGIASPAAIEKYGEDFKKNPVGTGPFKFEEWKEEERIVIVKNEDYWKEGYPKLDKVIFKPIADNQARLNALFTGDIDLMDGISYTDIAQVTSKSEFQMFERKSNTIGYLGLTNTREPLDNKLVRQALNHAVNKQEIADAFYGGYAVPAINPMPPLINGYHEGVEDYAFDVEKAKSLLAEAGYGDGFEMELWAMPVPRPYMPDGRKVAQLLQKQFEEIGVTAEIVSYEWGTYLDKAKAGEADAFLLGWTGDNGDADNFLYTLLGKDNIGSNNYAYYGNEEVNDLLVQAQTETDTAEREKLYMEAQEIIKDDAPWIPLVHAKPSVAGKENIINYIPHMTGNESLEKVDFK